MAWTPLANRLETLPIVLCGPILRKVTDTSATVWLALRRFAAVTLTVRDEQTRKVLEGTEETIAIGAKLHIVAVTARVPSGGKPLTEGVVYQYDLTFAFADAVVHTFVTATANAPLRYRPHPLPSFCLPPRDVNTLRLIQGSCRKPHGQGRDALTMLDGLIEQAALNPLVRPHQLLLTGDQIYADDVAASLIVMLTDAARTLLGWEEVLPFPKANGGPDVARQKPPFIRRGMLEGVGSTSDALDGHLLSFGEYLCMYLFAWSDVLWEGVPSFDELVDGVERLCDAGVFGFFKSRAKKMRLAVENQNKRLESFRSGLISVRRALANIPSYMIFDDHEITDDWNMTLNICLGLVTQPLGQQVIQNGLVAYALCQHWGNVPEEFQQASPPPPGRTLLELLDKGTAESYTRNTSKIRSLIGLPDHASIRANKAVFHEPGSLTYNFSVESPGHQVIFTDTRTWRFFSNGADVMSELLPKAQFALQMAKTPPTDGRALLVVVSTNAPPTQGIRTATQLEVITNYFEHVPDLYEAWEISSPAFDRLIKVISNKLPAAGTGSRGGAVLLSGDVHFSFASRLLFTGTSRFEDESSNSHPVMVVIAQLVASSFKNQDAKTLGLHEHGYKWGPKGTGVAIPPRFVETFAGWNLSPGTTLKIGEYRQGGDPELAAAPCVIDQSGTVPLVKWVVPPQFLMLSEDPHWRYRLEYLTPRKEGVLSPKLPLIPRVPSTASAEDRQKAASAFHVATSNYRSYDKSKAPNHEIVGVNNFSEITFDWGDGDQKRVNHTLRWCRGKTGVPIFTTYTVSLNPEDPPVKS
jgi:hypothetical protein